MCFCLIPAAAGDQATLDDALGAYRKAFPTRFPLTRSYDSFIRCSGCILYIHSWDEQPEDPESIIQNLRLRLGIDISGFRMGFSNPKRDLSFLKEAIEEALTAAVSSHIEKESFRSFSEIGSDAFILPFLDQPRYKDFYEKILALITTHDERYKAGLLDTLLCYTESDGDINLAAGKLFQHPNTIRHRMERIKGFMGTASSGDIHVQLHVFSRMHKIRNIFGNNPLI